MTQENITSQVATNRVSFDQLLLAGSHFGHLTRRWNPKMKKFILTSKNGIYLIDLHKTQSAIDIACNFAAQIAAKGEDIMFVGTKKQARDIIEKEAARCSCPFVTHRWLGGMLTNFSTIRKSLKTLENYEKMSTDGTYEKISKKEQLMIERDKKKLFKTLGGISNMKKIPSAIFIVDTVFEEIAVKEARKMGIPIIAIVDTNADPDLVEFPIPANDDAFKSIGLIANAISDAILEGKRVYVDTAPVYEAKPESYSGSNRPQQKKQGLKRRKPRGHSDRNRSETQAENTTETNEGSNE